MSFLQAPQKEPPNRLRSKKRQAAKNNKMAYNNKNEIKLYFESNNDTPKVVAERFKIKYRTLMFWIKSENWERGKYQKAIKTELVADELLQKEHFSIQNATASKIKAQMLENMGAEASKINEACLNAMLEEASDKLLLEAMSVNFIQKNIAQTCLIAKNELLELIAQKKEGKADVMIIAAAEKLQNMFANLQTSIYGKEPPKQVLQVDENTDFSKLSNAELEAIIRQGEQ